MGQGTSCHGKSLCCGDGGQSQMLERTMERADGPQFPVPELSDTQAALLKKVDSRAEEDLLTRAAVQAAQSELLESAPASVMMPSLQPGATGSGATAAATNGGDGAQAAEAGEANGEGTSAAVDASGAPQASTPDEVVSPGGDGGTGSAESGGPPPVEEIDDCETTPPPSDSPPKSAMEDWMYFYQSPPADTVKDTEADDARLLEETAATKAKLSDSCRVSLQTIKDAVGGAVSPVPSARCCTIACFRTLSASTRSSCEELFAEMDGDKDGSVSRSEAKRFFTCQFGSLSVDAMFNEVSSDTEDTFSLEEFMMFWKQVRKAGYSNRQIQEELILIKEGRPWVDWKDNRNVAGPEVHSVIAQNRASGRSSRLT